MATFLEICQAICDGIGIESPTTVASNTGDTERRLLALANKGGKALARMYDWAILQKEHTFTTVNGTAEYALPSDFGRFIDDTAWDRDAYMAMRGPLSASDWQVAKSGLIASAGIQKQWRLKRASASDTATFYIDPTPTNSTDDLVYEYIAKNWCASSGGTDQSAWAADTDVAILDEYLIELDLTWRMQERFGLSYQDARDEFERAAQLAYARDGGAAVVSLGRGAYSFGVNVPETGYGL